MNERKLFTYYPDFGYGNATIAKPPVNKKPESIKKSSLSDRIAILGISKAEMTQSVTLAVTALLEKLDDVTTELSRTRETLAEMERLVDVDCIAPIPNRRAFMRRLGWAIAMHERYNHPSSILYFDLNGFKAINDGFGHAAGDLAIKHVSQILLNGMRESDFLARIGGDEFALIMYYASEDAVQKRGAAIAEKIRNTPFVYNGKPISLNTAYGAYAIKSGDTSDTALAAADTAMYLDKKRVKEQAMDIKA